jgi:hypothetical protein
VYLGSNIAEFSAHERNKGDDMILNILSETAIWGNNIKVKLLKCEDWIT